MNIEGFKGFNDKIFYEPPEKNGSKESKTIYLTDVFTVWSGKKKVQPWLFSEGLRNLLELPSAVGTPIEEKKKILAEATKSMPETLTFPDGWNKYLKLWYKKEFEGLPKDIAKILEPKFEPAIFSVICYGKAGKTTQKLFAILERVKTTSEDGKPQVQVRLRKMYWV